MNKIINLAYSPCPNDTFIFYNMSLRKNINIHIYDVEQLNNNAMNNKYDITKLSFYAWLKVKNSYSLLNSGSALGFGCGPLLITRKNEKFLTSSKVAIPGEHTTAHLLYQLCYGNNNEKVFMPFDKIMGALKNYEVDAAVIIHEGRFIFNAYDFRCEIDLGEWWTEKTNLPIPLGCIVAKNNISKENIINFEEQIIESIEYAKNNKKEVYKYIRKYAQEMNDDIISQHIETYVNKYTLSLNNEGLKAIHMLEKEAIKNGLIE